MVHLAPRAPHHNLRSGSAGYSGCVPQKEIVPLQSAVVDREIVLGVPDPRLRAHVKGYCGYVESGPGLIRRVQLPSPTVELIVGFGPPVRIAYPHQDGSMARMTSFVAGLHDSRAIAESTGQQGVQIKLTPLGAYMVLGVPMDTLTNRALELEQVLGRFAASLTERLYETPSWEARFRLLDALLARRLAAAREPSPAVTWAWRRLIETNGRLDVSTLTEELGSSRQYLVSRFRKEVGLPPKTLARILRLQSAVRMLERDSQPRLTEVAQESGYFDQAHFNRDFRKLTGGTPTEFLAGRLPDGTGVVCR